VFFYEIERLRLYLYSQINTLIYESYHILMEYNFISYHKELCDFYIRYDKVISKSILL